MTSFYVTVLCLYLAGCALMGRGFASLGIPPIYPGELLLGCALLCVVFTQRAWSVLQSGLTWLLGSFMLWGLIRTVPYVTAYGLFALRDAVIWAYGLFAIGIAGAILSRPKTVGMLLARYAKAAKIFLLCAPLVWLVSEFYHADLPTIPGTTTALVEVKTGEILIHLAGITALVISGYVRFALPWLLLLAGSVCACSTGRGGLLAYMVTVFLCLALRPSARRFTRLICGFAVLVALMALLDVQFTVPALNREVSLEQMTSGLMSSVSDTGDQRFEGSKNWRWSWWMRIIEYTVNGEYRWTGKGYGVNLADDDRFQVYRDSSLRSPHNGHLTILARSGLPGIALWVLLQIAWACRVLLCYFRASARGQHAWRSLFLVLLAYWLAIILYAASDVALEGPMIGVWFWSIFGVGIAAVQLHRTSIAHGSGSRVMNRRRADLTCAA
jgi:hypothetical protein